MRKTKKEVGSEASVLGAHMLELLGSIWRRWMYEVQRS